MEQNDEIIPVYVQTLTGKSKRIWINRSARISSMQWPVAVAFGIPCEYQVYILLKNSMQLDPNRTFALYNIDRDAFIDVVVQLRVQDMIDNIYIEPDPNDLRTPITIQLEQLNIQVHHMIPKTMKDGWREFINFKPKSNKDESTKAYKLLKSVPSDWKKKARKVIPQTLALLGYDQRNIDLVVKTLKPVDASCRMAESARNYRVTKPYHQLAPLFEKYPDVVAEHLVKYLTLAERQSFSQTCRLFNKIARSGAVWKNLVLVNDWSNMTDKRFTKVMKDFGQFIERLSVQRCCYLTDSYVSIFSLNNEISIFGQRKNLTEIFGDCPNMTFAVLENIFATCLKLETIDIRLFSTNNIVPIEQLPSVKNLQHLRVLNLSNRIFADSSEISSQSLQILDIKNSFTKIGYDSLKIDCPNLTRLLTCDRKQQLNDSLKEKCVPFGLDTGLTVHNFSGAGNGDYFKAKILTKIEKYGLSNLSGQTGATIWIIK